MALGIGQGDEVITPSFTFIATAEAVALLGATPVFADIDPQTFNLDPAQVQTLITPKTKAIVPVHLFGQPAAMDSFLDMGIPVVEDNAQAIGATYKHKKTGFMGKMGTLSFFPSKNLGAYGDGGAIQTNDKELFARCKMIANHGGRHKYYNEIIGLNSRLDALQAAILRVKLRHLDTFTQARQAAADRYDLLFADCNHIHIPYRAPLSSHVFHQYTVRITGNRRDAVCTAFKHHGIPFGIYYPVPLHQLPVFAGKARSGPMTVTERVATEVLSLPMHSELTAPQQEKIATIVLQHIDT